MESVIKIMNFPKINQIGILVKDIPKAASYYSKLLGIGPWFRSKTARHDLVDQGKPIRLDLDIVIAFRGGMEYELQCGIITELIETKLKGIYVPQNRFMMYIGLVTGDVEKLRI